MVANRVAKCLLRFQKKSADMYSLNTSDTLSVFHLSLVWQKYNSQP